MSDKKKKSKAKDESSDKPVNLGKALKTIIEKGVPGTVKKKKKG